MSTIPFFIEPDLRRDRITVTLGQPPITSCTLTYQENEYTIDPAQPSCQIPIPSYEPWTPDDSNRIDLEWQTPADDSSSTVSLGMREFTIKDTRFYLNHRPIHIHAFTFEQTPNRAQLEQIKRSGFNTVILNGMVGINEALTACDEIGLLVWLQIPASTAPIPISAPSVVLIHLETENNDEVDGWKQLNPDKVIEFVHDGKTHHIRPYKKQPFLANPIEIELQTPIDGVTTQYLQNCGEPDRVNWLKLHAPPSPTSNEEKSTSRATEFFEDGETWNASLLEYHSTQTQLAIDAIRTNEKLAGYSIVPQDSSDPVSENLFQILQAPIRPLIFLQRINLVPRAETKVHILLANTLKLEGRADLSLQVIGPTNQVLWKKKRGIKIPKHGKALWDGSISASGSTGIHTFVVRIIQNMKQIAESKLTFYVYPEATPLENTVNVLDPAKNWTARLTPFVGDLNWHSLVHIVPPLANTIRAYPDNELAQIFGSVYQGASVLVFDPPADWNEWAHIVEPELAATPIGSGLASTVPYARLHPVFENTPARTWMGHTFADLIPSYGFQETSDEPVSELVSTDNEKSGETLSSIHVKRFGSGRVIFVGLKILENIEHDSVAQHLFVNLVKHVARRSQAAEGSLPVHQRAVEWLRNERMNHTRMWSIVGPFPDWNGQGMDNQFPPEDHIDFKATYPGWYKAIHWKNWFTTKSSQYRIKMDDAIGKINQNGQSEPGVTYAYTEINSERRGSMRLLLNSNCQVRIWVNQTVVLECRTPKPEPVEQEISLKQGRNTLMVKIGHSKNQGVFSVDLEPIRENIPVKWGWKPE